MATLRVDQNVFEPLRIDDKELSYGKIRFKIQTTEPIPPQNEQYLQIIFNDDHKAEHETILQLKTEEIIELHNVIISYLLPRIRKHIQSNESDTLSV